MRNGCLHKLSEMNSPLFIDELSDKKNIRQWIISTAYSSSLFEFFALFAALLLVILTIDNDAILEAYLINTYAHDGKFYHINAP